MISAALASQTRARRARPAASVAPLPDDQLPVSSRGSRFTVVPAISGVAVGGRRSQRDTLRMAASSNHSRTPARLRCGIVLHVQEDECQVLGAGQLASVGYVRAFPSPRTQRVSPGHLVAVATAAEGAEAVVWRWYDAVVLAEQTGLVRLWEPAHGEVIAHSRRAQQHRQPGTRAYLSRGLPGADWWVSGAAVAKAEDADVELDEVGRFCSSHDLWPGSP